MSDEALEFTRLMARKNKESFPIQTAYAICTSVNWEAKTMTTKGQTDELEYYDVKLGNGFEYKRPKTGTLCLIGLVQNQAANAFLIDANEVEEYYVKTGTSELQVKEAGIHVKRGDEDLKTVLNAMIVEINKIKVIYGNTINVEAMNEIKNRLNTILI